MGATRHIVYMDMDLLQPAVRNPKTHDLPSIVASLRRYGFNSPAELDERTGRLVAGHGRREGCQQMRANGEPPPAGVFIDDDGGWLIPVLRDAFRSTTDVEAEAYIIAQNKTGEAGGYHEKTLAQMLEDVVTEDAPLQETLGMDFEDIDALLARFDPEKLNDPPSYDDRDADAGGVPDPDPHGDLPTGDESVVKTPHTCPNCFHEFED